jgi:FtsH-binding integral membrane protein
MRVYKAVTVFTTLFAVVTVVAGFIVLDSATNRAQASLAEVDPLLALLGIGLIVAGAAAYAFSTRFRAEGMGKSKDDTDEGSDNG